MSASNFVFHMVVGRLLEPSEYGALGALLGLMLVFQVPVAALQVAISRQVAARRAVDPLAEVGPRHVLRQVGLVAVGAALVLVLASPLLRTFLRLDSAVPVWLLAADLFPLMLGLVPRGVFLGEQRYRPVGGGLVAGAGVRLLLGFVFGRAGFGVSGAMAATVLGDVVLAALLLTGLGRRHRRGNVTESATPTSPPLRLPLGDATAAAVAFAGLLLLTGADTVLARYFLPAANSGIYAAASTAGHSALFLATAIGLVAFPLFARTGGEGPVARRALVRALVATALSGGLIALVIGLFPRMFLTLLLGDQYVSAAKIVGLSAASSALLGACTVLVYFHLARRSPLAWFPWVALVAVAGAIVVRHQGPLSIARVDCAVMVVITGIVLVGALRATTGEERLAEAQRHRPPPPTNEGEIDITVVVPHYNPGPRFVPSLENLVRTLRAEDVTFEIIAVSDGSTDGSAEALAAMKDDAVRSVVLDRNWGKGEALRVGLSLGRGRYLGFIDADGDIDAALFHPYLALVELYQPHIVLGSKRHPMSDVEYPLLRRVYSWGFQQLVRVLFWLDVSDTQTGVKLVRRDVVAGVLPRLVERGFAFDLELFVVARHLGYRRVFEAPVRIGTRFSSSVSYRAALSMFREAFQIFYRLRVLRAYDLESGQEISTTVH